MNLVCEGCGILDETVCETTEPYGCDGSGNILERDAALCVDCYHESWEYE